MTANAFVSVSLEPPLVLVSLGNKSRLHGLIPQVGRYGISVLSEEQEHLSNHFAGRIIDGIKIEFSYKNEVPLIEGAVAHFVVEVADAHPAGDHTLYIGRVEHFQASDGQPLLFFGGKYQRLRAGKAKTTPWPQDEFSLFSIGPFDPPVS